MIGALPAWAAVCGILGGTLLFLGFVLLLGRFLAGPDQQAMKPSPEVRESVRRSLRRILPPGIAPEDVADLEAAPPDRPTRPWPRCPYCGRPLWIEQDVLGGVARCPDRRCGFEGPAPEGANP